MIVTTVDNASSNYATLGQLNNYIREVNKSIMGTECLFVRCVTYIPSLIVTDSLKDVDDLVARIKNVMRFVISLPAKLENFKVTMRTAYIECKNGLCLHVHIR